MDTPSKVLWAEGLFLQPQHFQQQDLYHEARLNRTVSALHPHAWGVRSISWNKAALANHTLMADGMSLIFQDGEIYDAPGSDALPLPVDLSKLSLDYATYTFHAALPILKGHGGNAGATARFTQVDLNTPDMYTGALGANVSFLKKTVSLVSDKDSLAAFLDFPVVRVNRVAGGGFEIDSNFMPPSLSIDAAGSLLARLGNLMMKMQVKVDALHQHHSEPNKNVIELRTGDISSFWLQNTLSVAYAYLKHYATHPQLHPARLFEQMLGCAGGLMTFSKDYTLRDLPDYAHRDPGQGFSALIDLIGKLVDTVISSKYFKILLDGEEVKAPYFYGQLNPALVNEETILYLAVSGSCTGAQLLDVVAKRYKLGSPEDVKWFVNSALAGVPLTYAPQVPREIPVRPSTYYFLLERKNKIYTNMLKAQAITIYIGDGIPDLKVELIGIAA